MLERLESWGALALQAIGALLAIYVALKWWERRRFYKMLRVARIGVDELHGGLDAWIAAGHDVEKRSR